MKEEVTDFGNCVVCDLCGKDWTSDKSNARGGFLLQSKGVCPDCAPKMKASLREYGETRFIRDEQQESETFAEACMRWRNGDNTVRVYTLEQGESIEDLRRVLAKGAKK